jgi:SM-20-related protein
MSMQLFDLAALRAVPLAREPFEYFVLPGFVLPQAREAINAAYPRIDQPGSFPVRQLHYGPAFGSLIEALEGPEMRAIFEDKFGIDLTDRPTTITVRGRCGAKDGSIHTDTASKLLTVLIYLNPRWEGSGGCLRLLRSPTDLEDVIVEVPPVEGTLLAFRRSDNSWHGHKPFIGPRRVIQLNWVTGQGAARSQIFRHHVSAWFKRMLGRLWPSPTPDDYSIDEPGSTCHPLPGIIAAQTSDLSRLRRLDRRPATVASSPEPVCPSRSDGGSP